MEAKKANFIECRAFGSRMGSNYIGITSNGTISFYSGFYLKKGISLFKNCLILYDKSQGLLGLQFGNEELGKGCFKLNHSKYRKTASIAAANFFKLNNELMIDQLKGKYIPEHYEEEGRQNVFIIDLNKKI